MKPCQVALVFCVHHKPWLIKSTLISVMAQDFKDFDIYFLHQQSDAFVENLDFAEYQKLSQVYGSNPHLDVYDAATEDVCKLNGDKIFHQFYNNDHALDSGAWYKFIRSGAWKKYDYVFFLGEGALLTGETVLKDTLTFAQERGVHFITGSQEKRRIPKNVMFSNNSSADSNNVMSRFHDLMIRKVFEIFCRDQLFKKVFNTWQESFPVMTENHVPDVVGEAAGRLNSWLRRFSLIRAGEEYIYVNGQRRKLSSVVNFEVCGRVKFHCDNDPAWFGCCCNHFVSREFLEKLSAKLEEFNIYDFFKIPYSGSALEVIWGMIPSWLGFDKWFFNGIHRVRKHFATYRREDNAEGMVRYLNRYFAGKLKASCSNDCVKIKKLCRGINHFKQGLNSYYFMERY